MRIRFTPTAFAPSVHLVMKIAFRYCKDTVFLLQSINHTEILFHFFTQKFGHFNGAVAFFRFRGSNHILSFQTLIGFIDCDCFLIKVKIPPELRLTARPLGYHTNKAFQRHKKETGLSIISKENFLYSSFVQNSISLCSSLPIFPTFAAGLERSS